MSALAPLQRQDGMQVLVVGSSAFGCDRQLVERLREQGIRVIDEYLPRVEEVYQLADCYAFPVQAEENAIEVPLSVLEAMACNLPVVATPYGGLSDRLPEGDGLWYAEGDQALRERICTARGQSVQTRERVLHLAWPLIADAALSETCQLLGLSGK